MFLKLKLDNVEKENVNNVLNKINTILNIDKELSIHLDFKVFRFNIDITYHNKNYLYAISLVELSSDKTVSKSTHNYLFQEDSFLLELFGETTSITISFKSLDDLKQHLFTNIKLIYKFTENLEFQ